MPTHNHTLFSLYENPLAAGTISSETASCDRLVEYLLRDRDESALALATVESLPHVPPRANVQFAPVMSMPALPPRAHVEFAPVMSMPSLPPRAVIELAPVVSFPVIPPRA
jgi:hypothetical protein